jgi:hypothetical protein
MAWGCDRVSAAPVLTAAGGALSREPGSEEVQVAVTTYEDPDALRTRLKLGREEFCQRLLTSLIVGGAYPRWNTRSQPSLRGLRFLSDLDEVAFGTRYAGAPLFIDELDLPRRHDGEMGCAPDYGVLWTDRLWMVELKTERASHRRDQLGAYFEFARHHFPALRLDLLYLTPPMPSVEPPVPPGSRFAHLRWGDVAPLVALVWGDSAESAERRIAQRLLAEVDGLAVSAREWRAGSGPGGAAQAGGSAPFDVALSVAEDVERAGRQRALDVVPGSLEQLLELRLAVRDALRAPDSRAPHVRPWLWSASSSGGRALTASGESVGYELRLSRYDQASIATPALEESDQDSVVISSGTSGGTEQYVDADDRRSATAVGTGTHTPERLLLHRDQHTLHILDDGRSTLSEKWTKCSWPLEADKVTTGPLDALRRRDPTAVPCDECFPGRHIPPDGASRER